MDFLKAEDIKPGMRVLMGIEWKTLAGTVIEDMGDKEDWLMLNFFLDKPYDNMFMKVIVPKDIKFCVET